MPTDEELFAGFDASFEEFARLTRLVTPASMTAPTPCSEWDVQALLQHVIGGARSYAAMLGGCSAEEAARILAAPALDDAEPIDALLAAHAQLDAALRAKGALDRLCRYLNRDLLGRQILTFRVLDGTVHSWDLAQAIGEPDQLSDALLRITWDILEPLPGATQLDDIKRLIDRARTANPQATIGLSLYVAAGTGRAVEHWQAAFKDGCYHGLAGEPERVADTIRRFARLDVDRITVMPPFKGTAAALAPHLLH